MCVVTSKDVAARAGVAQSTVSYVMSGKRSISPETRAKVEAAIAELTYHPNAGARALASNRTSVIGLVVSMSRTTEMAGLLPFIEAITSDARVRDHDVVLVTEEAGTASLERLAGRSLVDAIVLMDVHLHDVRLERAAQLAVPVVLIGLAEDNHGLDAVDFDFEAAGTMAAEELLDRGYTRVVVVGEPPEVNWREYGFIAGFERGALEACHRRAVAAEVLRPAAPGWSAFLAAVSEQLGNGRASRVGFIARTPQTVAWVLQLLLIERLEPGRDVGLVGMCTDEDSETFSTPVTNVSPRPREVSHAAMNRVFELLNGAEPGGRIQLIPPRLTRRRTT